MPTTKMFKCFMLLLLFSLVPAKAQTSGELRQKYGNPDDKGRYVVRPGVMMSVTAASNGKVSDVWIEAQSAPQLDDPAEKGIPQKILAGLINEFAPISRRGRYIRSLTFSGGCTSIAGTEYEHVTVQQTSLCAAGGRVLSSAAIHWKEH